MSLPNGEQLSSLTRKSSGICLILNTLKVGINVHFSSGLAFLLHNGKYWPLL